MAGESARVKSSEPRPPRLAEALLRSLLKPADRESIPGDLLEEYRAAKQPVLGTRRANLWYVRHVLSVLWRLVRPCALAIAALTLLMLAVNRASRDAFVWYGSVVQAPGVSLLHALIYSWAGFYASHRTRLIKTGMLAAAITSAVGFTVLFTSAAIATPGLMLVPFRQPFVFVILSTLLLIALGYGVAVGTLGSIIGRWVPPGAARKARTY